MFVNNKVFFASNPFFDSYIHSDFLGKMIFIALILLSICSWAILIHKIILNYQARKNSRQFIQSYQQLKGNPLGFDIEKTNKMDKPNPFLELYLILKKQTIEILNKNRRFGMLNSETSAENHISYLSPADIDIVESHLLSHISYQTKNLEKNLFILSTVVSLAPFLGLLGTVWGILTFFSEFQTHQSGETHQVVLSGLSLALATTVLGLIDAIPALIGYNYLKNFVRDFETDMEGFSTEILAQVEMQYRKVDIR